MLAPRVVDVLVSPQGLDVLSGGLESPDTEGCFGGSAGHSAGTQVPASGGPSRLKADSVAPVRRTSMYCLHLAAGTGEQAALRSAL
jgi:hypothetical protein